MVSAGDLDKQPAINSDSFFLPDLCEKGNLLLLLLIAELLAIVLAVVQPGAPMDRLRYFALVSLFIQWVAFGGAAALCTTRRWLRELSSPVAGVACFFLLQAVTLLVTALTYGVMHSTGMTLILPDGWLLDSALRNLLISIAVTAIALRYFYVQHQWKLNLQIETSSRIRALQARIRPHFLFNAMNSIASLTRTDPVKAEVAVEDLAELFRASLADRDNLSLEEELELTRTYLRIETLRLGERLKLEWDIDLIPTGIKLPALTIQPLVENAIYHGIEGLPDGGIVRVSVHQRYDKLEIRICNPLPPNASDAKRRGNHVAQTNVRERLALAFEHQSSFTVEVLDGNYCVSIQLPANTTRYERLDRR